MQQASSDVVRRAGLEPACLSASVFETDSYTCSGTCAFGTRRETRTPMPLRAPVPETGVSTNSTSRVFFGDPIEVWFDGEKEEGDCGYAAFAALTQTAEAKCSRLLPTWYAERESNSQARYGRRPLRPMCLPFHHLRILAE